jgi:DNA-binding NarL/FixJ family response regulator
MKKSAFRLPNHSVRVAVVEDHTVVRQALVFMLKKEPQVIVAFHAENGREFLDQLPNHEVDVVLLDLDLPVMDGRETLKHLQKDFPHVKAIMLSMHEDPWIVSELINEGAKSFLKKNCSFDELMDALFDVKFKGSHTTELVEQAMFSKNEERLRGESNVLRYELNSREQLVLKQICDGKTSEQIAERMHLSKKSIDAIRSDLLKRIGAKNSTELARKSMLLGLYKARTDEQIIEEEENEVLAREQRRRNRLKG